MAKVAVSSQGKTLESPVDPRFGRAAYFLVVDMDTNDFVVLDNTRARDMAHGAGIQAAELVARSGAEAILSGVVGPKAWQALEAGNVKIVQDAQGAVADAVKDYREGKIKPGSDPMGNPHGGMGGGMGGGGGRGMGGGGGRGMGGGGRGMGGGGGRGMGGGGR